MFTLTSITVGQSSRRFRNNWGKKLPGQVYQFGLQSRSLLSSEASPPAAGHHCLQTGRSLFLIPWTLYLAGVAILLAFTPCSRGADTAKAAAPAQVEHGVKETELCTLTLTLQAEQRLAIGLAEVIKKRMPLTRVLVGEILAVPGRSVAVLAPFPSSVISGSGAVPRPGGRVKQGQQVCELQLLMGPAERVRLAGDLANAEALVKQATARVANAQISLQRQETMLRAQATSQKALEEASLQKLVAEAELKAAQQLAVLLKGAGEMNANTTTVNLTLTSPLSGILLSLDVTPGQSLAAGSPVFTVVDMQKAWVRVPAFGSEAALMRRNTEVTISPVAARMGEPAWSAKAIEGPPTANPTTASVDLYFEMDNAKALFRPHQRVSVNLVLESDAENLVVPWAAIIHDINGGQWVYEKRSPQTYARRRVEVARVAGNQAILARGPQPGTLVVTDGAAELFGTEFGGTK